EGIMAEDIRTKLENYKTAPFDSRFPNQNQTRNCWQNYLGCIIYKVNIALCKPIQNTGAGAFEEFTPKIKQQMNTAEKCNTDPNIPTTVLDFHRCEKAMNAKGQDPYVCQWYKRVYKSLCPISWVTSWDERMEEGTFPGKI
ncbi:hypothetical protein JD844_005660, partial [Phrynosoma platyrhinos]